MSVATPFVTANQLLQMPRDGWRYELVKGELRRMSPAGHYHGSVAARFLILLGRHVEANNLGKVYAAETGFILESDPDTVRAPDVAFISTSRLAKIAPAREGFFPGAPDLAVEVTSPSDTYSDVESKAMHWLRSGCQVVIVVDPRQEHAVVYRAPAQITILSRDELIAVEDVVPGWSINVTDLFR